MRFNEFSIAKSPDQIKVNALKVRKDVATKALADERKRQQVAKAKKTIATLQAPSTPTV